MNKQEAKDFFNNLCGNLVAVGDGEKYIELGAILDIIDRIESQKPVIPKFVADWIEYTRAECYSLYGALEMAGEDSEIFNWLFNGHKSNQEAFAHAWLFSYEIKQEKLYTVEIPDPNRPDTVTFLYKENGKVFIGTDIFLDEVPNYKWKKDPENQLTESEIKQDFEWAWDAGFAKEVE